MAEIKGFRFYFDKDYDFLFNESMKIFNNNERESKRDAKKRLRMYANLYTRDLRKLIVNENSVCVFCDSNHKLQLDHIIAITKGGKNTTENIQILCCRCNNLKRDK